MPLNSQKYMKLIVENLGPIEYAEIDLNKKFYCFVGYNNSGKTYLASLLSKVWDVSTFYLFLKEEKILDLPLEHTLTIDEAWAKEVGKKYAHYLVESVLPNLFNIPSTHTIINNTKLSFINWEFLYPSLESEFLHKDFEVQYFINPNQFKWNVFKEENKRNVINTAFRMHFFQNKAAHLSFLPAERSFYSKFNSYFFRLEQERKQDLNKQIQGLLSKGDKVNAADIQQLANQSKNEYSEPMYDLLKKYYEMFEGGKVPQKTNFYEKEVARLAKLMGGEVVIETIDGFPVTKFKSHQETVEDLEMYLASSSVNQLSVLMTYFKFWAKEENNLLILDEPEENLHPSAVVKLLEILIDFANKNNNQVLITTHSPLLVEALNNQLVLGQLENKEEVAEELGYANETFLAKEEAGVYYFSGKKVYSYEVGDYGTTFRDFKAVTDKVESDNSILSEALFHQLKKTEKEHG